MATNDKTRFSLDVLGRYVCNDMAEVAAATAGTDARPFDVIVVGGGSFASIFAQHLMTTDEGRQHRILVLEAGPMLVGEHVQNLPMIGLDVPRHPTHLRAPRRELPPRLRTRSGDRRGTPTSRSSDSPTASAAGPCTGAGGRPSCWPTSCRTGRSRS